PAARPTPAPTPAPVPASGPSKADSEAVLATVNAWAKAWSARDAEAYLSHYAPNFQVPGGDTRSAWEAMRRERVTRPKRIEVTVGSPKVSFDASGRAIVRFKQSYKSDTLDTSGMKTLTLVKTGERWQIQQEKMN